MVRRFSRSFKRRAKFSTLSTETITEEELCQLVQGLENGSLLATNETYSTLLRACVAGRCLEAGKRVHSHLLKSGADVDLFVRNGIVELYGKCGELDQAKEAFDRMERRNSYSWNVMVAAYAQKGDLRETLRTFQEMVLEGHTPYKHSYANMLTVCTSLGALSPGRDIHPDVAASGLDTNVIVATALVNLYGRCGSLCAAAESFRKIRQPDNICWSTMLAVLAHRGLYRDSVELYRRMLMEGVVPEEITLVTLVTAFTNAGALREAQELHRLAETEGVLRVDGIFAGSLVNLYGKLGHLEAAEELHARMTCRNVVSWTALISAYAQCGYSLHAVKSWRLMDLEGVRLNDVTFINLLGCCYTRQDLEFGRRIHSRLISSGHIPDDVLGTAVVSMYGRCGSVREAEGVFDEMKLRDTVAWNAMMGAFVSQGYWKETCELCRRMQVEGGRVDEGSFVSLMEACVGMDALELGREFHGWIAGTGYEREEGIASAVINMYGKCGERGNALDVESLFGLCWRRSLLPWNSLASAYTQLELYLESLGVLRRMDHQGLKFDVATFVTAFCLCSNLGCVETGELFHERLLSSGLPCNVTVWNALIMMYGRCDRVEQARKVFESVEDRDVITWNAIFSAYAQKGESSECVKLLRRMDMEGVRGDEITLATVLTACGCSATLRDSQSLHERAVALGLEDGDTVGGLLVNAYGKCGSLETARRVFDGMKRKSLFTWTALLASYAQHGQGKEALEIYRSMDVEGLKPSEVTFISILFACSHSGLVEEGRYYFLSMTGDHGLRVLEDHFKCMMDLFARVGMLGEVEELIEEMPFMSDSLSWMTLLAACKVHRDPGRGDRAAANALNLDPLSSTTCVMLTNLYSDDK